MEYARSLATSQNIIEERSKKRKILDTVDKDRTDNVHEDPLEAMTTSSGASSTGRLHIIEGLRRQDLEKKELRRKYRELSERYINQNEELQREKQANRAFRESTSSLEKQVSTFGTVHLTVLKRLRKATARNIQITVNLVLQELDDAWSEVKQMRASSSEASHAALFAPSTSSNSSSSSVLDTAVSIGRAPLPRRDSTSASMPPASTGRPQTQSHRYSSFRRDLLDIPASSSATITAQSLTQLRALSRPGTIRSGRVSSIKDLKEVVAGKPAMLATSDVDPRTLRTIDTSSSTKDANLTALLPQSDVYAAKGSAEMRGKQSRKKEVREENSKLDLALEQEDVEETRQEHKNQHLQAVIDRELVRVMLHYESISPEREESAREFLRIAKYVDHEHLQRQMKEKPSKSVSCDPTEETCPSFQSKGS